MLFQYAVFFSIILLLTGGSWFIVSSFVVDLIPGGTRTMLTLWALSVSPLFILIRNFARHAYPSAAVRLFAYRPFWYAQLMMIFLAFGTTLGALLGLPFGGAAFAGRLVVLVGAPVLVLFGIAGYFGSQRLAVKHIELRFPNLPASLAGLRIVMLSDLHVGPHTPVGHLRRIAEETERAKPDLIAFAGDQVDDYPRDVEVFEEYFGRLKAPLGVYAIPGNHDVYAGWPQVRRGLEDIGVKVLVNDAVALSRGGTRFWLAGTGDPAGRQLAKRPGHNELTVDREQMALENAAPDINRMLKPVTSGSFVICLAHNPALFPALAARDVDVTLSGHTHYGQFSIPALKWSLATPFLEYAMGWYQRGASQLYIGPGANYWGIPFRIGTPAEVSVITLEAGTQAQ